MGNMGCFELYDASRKQYRSFCAELTYKPRCGNELHQFAIAAVRCACGKFPSEGRS